MKIISTIEARMSSSRLPGKVLLKANGKPMLQHLIERLNSIKKINQIVIATTTNNADDAIVDFAKSLKVDFYRGSEKDVMQRVIEAAESVNADLIVQITGDCPIIDPNIISLCLETYLSSNVDYLSNANLRTYPDGMDVQIFKLDILKDSASRTKSRLDREHVTLHIKKNPQLYSQLNLLASQKDFFPELGLTLDEKEDYLLISKIINHFKNKNYFFKCHEVINLLKDKKEWLEINNHIIRKGDS